MLITEEINENIPLIGSAPLGLSDELLQLREKILEGMASEPSSISPEDFFAALKQRIEARSNDKNKRDLPLSFQQKPLHYTKNKDIIKD